MMQRICWNGANYMLKRLERNYSRCLTLTIACNELLSFKNSGTPEVTNKKKGVSRWYVYLAKFEH